MKSEVGTNLDIDQWKFLIWLIGWSLMINTLIKNINHRLLIFDQSELKFFDVYEYVSR